MQELKWKLNVKFQFSRSKILLSIQNLLEQLSCFQTILSYTKIKKKCSFPLKRVYTVIREKKMHKENVYVTYIAPCVKSKS